MRRVGDHRRPARGAVGAEPAGSGDGAVGAEVTLLTVFVLFRCSAAVQVLIAVAISATRLKAMPAGILLAAVFCAQSAVLVGLGLRRRAVPAPAVLVVEALWVAVQLPVGAVLAGEANAYTWVNFMYPASIIVIGVFGLGQQRLAVTVGVSLVVTTCHGLSRLFIAGTPMDLLREAAPLMLDMLIGVWVARAVRRDGVALDVAVAVAARREADVARERQAADDRAELHQQLLDVLGEVATGPWLVDPTVRDHVAGELAWLRAFVGLKTPDTDRGDLLAALQTLAAGWPGRQLAVDLRVDPVCTEIALPPETLEAVIGAVREALTNVDKHAGTGQAVLWATRAGDGLVLTVRDRGRGFDPAVRRNGVGLTGSIEARLAVVGGETSITAAPGCGAEVRLRVPITTAERPGGGARRLYAAVYRDEHHAARGAVPRDRATPPSRQYGT